MLAYQIIYHTKYNDTFVTLFEESEKQKAFDCYDYTKMQKYVTSAMLIGLDAPNCHGTILKTFRE